MKKVVAIVPNPDFTLTLKIGLYIMQKEWVCT